MSIIAIPKNERQGGSDLEYICLGTFAYGAHCKVCDCGMKDARGGGARFSLRCPKCGIILYLYTTPRFLPIWDDECPGGMTFGEYAQQRMDESMANAERAAIMS